MGGSGADDFDISALAVRGVLKTRDIQNFTYAHPVGSRQAHTASRAALGNEHQGMASAIYLYGVSRTGAGKRDGVVGAVYSVAFHDIFLHRIVGTNVLPWTR